MLADMFQDNWEQKDLEGERRQVVIEEECLVHQEEGKVIHRPAPGTEGPSQHPAQPGICGQFVRPFVRLDRAWGWGEQGSLGQGAGKLGGSSQAGADAPASTVLIPRMGPVIGSARGVGVSGLPFALIHFSAGAQGCAHLKPWASCFPPMGRRESKPSALGRQRKGPHPTHSHPSGCLFLDRQPELGGLGG